MAEGDTLLNALVGAVVTAITAPFIPFAPIAGGAVAGYLEGGTSDEGIRVGAYAGLVALVPLVLIFMLVGSIFVGLLVGFAGFDGFLVGGVGVFIFFVLLVVGLIYVVGLSILGGWLGNYLKTETDL